MLRKTLDGIAGALFLYLATLAVGPIINADKKVDQLVPGGMKEYLSMLKGRSLEKKIGSKSLEELTEANQALRRFPDSLEGAVSVDKYEVLGAKQCLVCVDQLHYAEHWEGRSNEEQEELYRAINGFQKNVYGIFDNLIKNHGFSNAYLEGCLNRSSPDEARDQTHVIYFILREEGFFVDEIDKLEECGFSNLDEFENIKYLPGAGKLHAMQGNIKVRPLERKDINNKLKEMDTSIGVAEPLFDNWVYDGREYGLLKNVSEDGDASALATLGRSHDIKDNISLWNEMNPDNKFSYIRIKTKED